MTPRLSIFRWAIPALAILSAGFALDRFLAASRADGALSERAEALAEAKRMAATLSRTSSSEGGKPTPSRSDLKETVKEAGMKTGVALVYLAESERDAGKDLKEKDVVARALSVRQENLVRFLAEVEKRGGGAWVKEIRLKPAKEESGVYEEMEATIALRWAVK